MVYQSREKHHQYKEMTKRITCPRKKVILKKRRNTLSKHVWEPQILDEHGYWGSHSTHNWPHRETLGHANGQPTAITWGWEAKGLLDTIYPRLITTPLGCHIPIKVRVYTGLQGTLYGGWGRETIWDRMEGKGLVQDPVSITHKAPRSTSTRLQLLSNKCTHMVTP